MPPLTPARRLPNKSSSKSNFQFKFLRNFQNLIVVIIFWDFLTNSIHLLFDYYNKIQWIECFIYFYFFVIFQINNDRICYLAEQILQIISEWFLQIPSFSLSDSSSEEKRNRFSSRNLRLVCPTDARAPERTELSSDIFQNFNESSEIRYPSLG